MIKNFNACMFNDIIHKFYESSDRFAPDVLIPFSFLFAEMKILTPNRILFIAIMNEC